MDERLKLLLLLNYVNANAETLDAIGALGVSAKDVFRASSAEALSPVMKAATLSKLRAAYDAAWAEEEAERVEKSGLKLITIGEENYPRELLDLKDAPLVLYLKGDAKKLPDETKIGVVGTRRASSYGKEAASRIGAACASCGIALVSGGAWGIDGASQAACCRAGGVTFAVLGTGVDKVYPAANEKLFGEIAEKGALISEFPLGTNGEPWRFPQRNRIVAAVCEKIIVVEAPIKSGSMITARRALELGREVWAVPGRVYDANARGTNLLIYDGAHPYISEEIFFERCGVKIKGREKRAERTDLSPGERAVLNALVENGAMTIDRLSVAAKMTAAEALKYISLLSARGEARMTSPGRYAAKDA